MMTTPHSLTPKQRPRYTPDQIDLMSIEDAREAVAVLQFHLDEVTGSGDDGLAVQVSTFFKYIHIQWPGVFPHHLTATEARLLTLLINGVSRHEALHAGMYHDRISEDEIPDRKITNVFICKLRRKLRPLGISINTIWGRGYVLNHREALKRQIRAFSESGILPTYHCLIPGASGVSDA